MVSFGLVGPTELSRASQQEPPPREVTKLFPPMPVPAPSVRRLRMCGGHPCAPWRSQTLTCCATSRCCFLRTGRKQCMRDSFRLRYPAGSFSFARACHSQRSPTPELRGWLGESPTGKQRGGTALARSCGRGRCGPEGGAARRSRPEVGSEVWSVSLAESFPEFPSSLTTPQVFEIYRVLWVHY